MNKLLLKGTNFSPKISFNLSEGRIKITGRSFDDDVIEKFNVLNDWVELYSKVPLKNTRVDIALECFSSVTTKSLYDVLEPLVKMDRVGRTNLKIYWYVDEEDEDTIELVGHFSDFLEYKINHIPTLST